MGIQNPRMATHVSASDPAVGSVALMGSVQTLATSGRGLLITVTGDIEFTMQDGSTVDWDDIPVGIHALTVATIVSATATGYVLL